LAREKAALELQFDTMDEGPEHNKAKLRQEFEKKRGE